MYIINNENEFNVNNGLFAVKFWATWCAPCQRMDPLVKKIEKEFPEVKFMSVNIDDVPEIAQKYMVRSLPCIILVKNGVEVNRINGLILTEPLRKAFRDFTNTLDLKIAANE
jgi:thioredoxin